MRRWALVLALLLSLGVNVGILTMLALNRFETKKPGRENAERQPNGPAFPGGQGNAGEAGGQEGVPQRVVRLADLLGLEGDQRRRFIALQTGFFVETVRLRTEQSEIHRELRRALIAPQPDRARTDKLLHDSAATFLALEQALAKNVLDSRALLDPAQQKKYLEIIRRLRPNAGGVWGAPQPRNPRRQGRPPGNARQDGPARNAQPDDGAAPAFQPGDGAQNGADDLDRLAERRQRRARLLRRWDAQQRRLQDPGASGGRGEATPPGGPPP